MAATSANKSNPKMNPALTSAYGMPERIQRLIVFQWLIFVRQKSIKSIHTNDSASDDRINEI